MALPGRDEAKDWVGWTVVDRDGVELGPCTTVLADEATGLPEWVYVEVDGADAVVPALDAGGSGERVTVTVTRAQVTAAPSAGGARELSQALEADLYRHYGIEASRDSSESLLPAGATDTPAAGRAAAVAPAAVGAPALGAAAPDPRRAGHRSGPRRVRAGQGRGTARPSRGRPDGGCSGRVGAAPGTADRGGSPAPGRRDGSGRGHGGGVGAAPGAAGRGDGSAPRPHGRPGRRPGG